MKKQYSFLIEGPIAYYKKIFKNPDALGRFLNRTAAGGLVGGTMGGVIGFLYGIKVYESKERTLKSIEEAILNPDTSDYKRRQLIDTKNMILSMSDEEYRNYIVTKYYKQGAAIGSTIGSVGGSVLLGR